MGMDSFRSLDSTDSTSSHPYQTLSGRPTMPHMDSFRSIDSTDSNMSHDTTSDKVYPSKGGKKLKWKRRSGKPKRPLSAYNIFFKSERAKLVQAKKKVGFANMAKEISSKWKSLSEEGHKEYAAEAEIEQKKYRAAVKEWKAQIFLQKLLIQQQMMEQQKLMQEQIQNAIQFNANRRMSMPPMGCSSAPSFDSETPQQYEQQPESRPVERRLSLQLQATPQREVLGERGQMWDPNKPVDSTFECPAYDSTDESSLGDEMADMLINMPILDDVERNDRTPSRTGSTENSGSDPDRDEYSRLVPDDIPSEMPDDTPSEMPDDIPSECEILSKLLDKAESLSMEDMESLFS